MAKEKLIAEELMELYEELPDLIIYKNDLLEVDKTEFIEEIAGTIEREDLNPIDVVLESLINVLAERLSIDTLTETRNMVYMDKTIQQLAAQEVMDLVESDTSFLKEIHNKWTERLRTFVSTLEEKGIHTLQEALFQISLKFRISASSSLKAVSSFV